MPLSIIEPGTEVYISRISGRPETRQFLEGLGFTVGCAVKVVSQTGGNLIVQIKDSRIALNREMANKIFV